MTVSILFNSLSCKYNQVESKQSTDGSKEQSSLEGELNCEQETPISSTEQTSSEQTPKQYETQKTELVHRSNPFNAQKYFLYDFIPKYSKRSDGKMKSVAQCKKCHVIMANFAAARMKRH